MAERTKLWIADAMKRLLVKKPLGKIFVTDICKEAEIERPTFYYHFKDKYDLMAWIFCQQTMKTDVLSVESAGIHQQKNASSMAYEFTTSRIVVGSSRFQSIPIGIGGIHLTFGFLSGNTACRGPDQ